MHLSNVAFNNVAFTLGTIPWMEDERVHPSFERLLDAAKQFGGKGPSALASLLNESPQTINNWRRRGVSETGALKAQHEFGCDANWVLSGDHATKARWRFSTELQQKVLALSPPEIERLEGVMRAHLGMSGNSAVFTAEHQNGSGAKAAGAYPVAQEVGTRALDQAELPEPRRHGKRGKDRGQQRSQGGGRA